ncbi:MAG: zinc-ribbon domain-containing protein [Clostridia bacterium]|nr:zinc-ribbon domain-containing protein [Clostridia bacterium]
MKYCQHCGKELQDDALICVGCGRIVKMQNVVMQSAVKTVEEQPEEMDIVKVKRDVPAHDNRWIIRLFSYFFSIFAFVLYACSRKIEVVISNYSYPYGTLYANGYVLCDTALMIAALVFVTVAAILAIVDISLIGVDVSKRKIESSKLCAPILSLILPLMLIFVFIFMN